jgi:hypothetical protein
MSLEDDKNKIRQDIIGDVASGVVGVGVDHINSKLLVFSIRTVSSKPYLESKFGEDYYRANIWLRSGRVNLGSARSRAWKAWRRLTRGIVSSVTALSVKPGSDIQPMPGVEGVVGCFVLLADGAPGILTVQHIFLDLTSADVYLCGFKCVDKIGSLEKVGGISPGPGAGNVNVSDCALFVPQNVQLKVSSKFSGDFVDKGDMQDTVGAPVLNVASKKTGNVIDHDAMIVYTVYVGGGRSTQAIFDHQILVDGMNFGEEAYSGSPVVLASNLARASPRPALPQYAAVGLYSAIVGVGQYHFATPVHACLDNSNISALLRARSIKYP